MIIELKDSEKTLSIKAYEVLETEIVLRNLKPGTALREEDIARQLNISPTPVREAINKLEQEGLIYRKPHRSAIVKPLKESDVYELCEIRESLECLAIKLAAERISIGTIRELQKIVKKSEKYLNENRLREYVKTNRQFHDCIFRVAGNGRLKMIMSSIHNQLAILMLTTAKIPGKSKSATAQHKQMIKALEAKDQQLAVKIMKKHIRETLNDLLSKITNHKDGV